MAIPPGCQVPFLRIAASSKPAFRNPSFAAPERGSSILRALDTCNKSTRNALKCRTLICKDPA
jgi:hypothetical protein